MPSQIKREAVAESTLVGKLHATMSRDVMRREIQSERASAAASVSDQDFYAHTLKAEKKACKLVVRDGLGVVTTPLGAITGTARNRAEYKYQASASDDASDKLFGQARLGWRHVTEHFGDEGIVGAASHVLLYGSMAVSGGGVALGVGIPSAFLCGKAGLAAGAACGALVAAGDAAVVGTALFAVGQLAALPGAGLKAAGNGVGNVYASVVAKGRAKKALKARQDARAANAQPESSI